MPMSRRNVMTLLGLSPVGGAAFANDDVITLENNKREVTTGCGVKNEMIATALENLAKEMRADGVMSESLRLTSDVTVDNIFTQELTIRFVVVERAE